MALIPISRDRMVEVAEPTREMFPATLGGAVEYTVTHFVYSVLNVMGGAIGQFVAGFLVQFLETIEPSLIDYVSPLIDKFLSFPDIPPEWREFFEKLRDGTHEAGVGVLTGAAGSAASTGLLSFAEPFLARIGYEAWRAIPNRQPDLGSDLAMKWRGLLTPEQFAEASGYLGYQDFYLRGYEEIGRPRLDIADMLTLMWRGETDENSVRGELLKRGYAPTEADDLMKVAERLPGPGDLISMAVREAFHPDLVEKYQYMDNFPPEFAEWMEKQGFDRHWAEKYWTAHWRLPSIGQAFGMLHRGLISMDEVRDLLRTADVAPTWHDPIIATAYAVYTRVDTRRMHKMGILDDDQLVKAYMDQGYDEEHAVNMADFTLQYNTETERDATKTEILKGLHLGMFTPENTVQLLLDIGVTEQWAQWFVDMESIKVESERVEEDIKTVQILFTNGEIAEVEVHARLGVLNLAPDRVARLLAQWHVLRERKITRPTRGDLERFYRHGQIDDVRLADELGRRGYIPEYVSLYTEDLVIRMLEQARIEEEWARAEAEKVQLREVKTEYDVVRSQADLEIAELKVSKAEDKLLVMTTEVEGQAEELKVHILEIDVSIAELQEHKATVKLELWRG